MGFAFHLLYPRYSGPLTLTVCTAIRLRETFIYILYEKKEVIIKSLSSKKFQFNSASLFPRIYTFSVTLQILREADGITGAPFILNTVITVKLSKLGPRK